MFLVVKILKVLVLCSSLILVFLRAYGVPSKSGGGLFSSCNKISFKVVKIDAISLLSEDCFIIVVVLPQATYIAST